MTVLRDYQSEAISALYRWFGDGKGNPLVVAPTGSGKSVMLSEFIRRALADYPATRIVMVTHVKELIAQNYAAALRLWPEAPAGIWSAGLGRRQMRQITFAGIQTVARRAAEFGHIDLLVVDEAHLIPRSGTGLYRTFIDGLMSANPALKVVGFTATPFRLDSGRLDAGPERIFDGIAYDIPIQMLVQRGFLSPLISKRPGMTFDVAGLHTRGGEWIEAEMDARFNTDATTRAAVAEIAALGADRRSWLLFCISVAHAERARDILTESGVPAAVVSGATPAPERARILEDFKAGRLRAVTNVNVLTTGFDAPATDLIAFLRPTQSLGLYMQMAGRAMRTAPGKENGLVLDFAGNVARHGPVDAVSAASAGAKGGSGDREPGEAPTKTCPECDEIVMIGARECLACGYEFPAPPPKIDHTASTEAIMNMTAEDDWRPLRDFAMGRHVKDGKASLRVEYMVDLSGLKGVPFRLVKEFVCIEHTGFARQKAVQWWNAMAGTTPPDTVDEALARRAELRVPAEVVIRKEGEWWRVARTRGERVAA